MFTQAHKVDHVYPLKGMKRLVPEKNVICLKTINNFREVIYIVIEKGYKTPIRLKI